MGRYFLAVDIGASSGRHIVGWLEDGGIQTKEVYRFPNGVAERDGRLTWDVDALLGHVKTEIDRALAEFGVVESFSIDTWGCDYVLLQGDEEVRPCYAYRDNRRSAVIPRIHEIIPFETLYARTGCQCQPFNTLYQLCDDMRRGRLEGVTDFLMVPEYLLWKLTGVKAKEYTNATTTGLVNAQTGEFDLEVVKKLGLPEKLFPKLSQPGTAVGAYKGIKAVLCATHDTASAVEGIPMEGEQLYISSGTWSLLGVKTPKPLTDAASMAANYSKEGGVGYNRYQKNIMGMWIVNRLRDELCPGTKKLNLHASYAIFENGQWADRDKLEPKHFKKWVDFCKARGLGCDFNPTFFSHPKCDPLTLSSPNEETRRFWIDHGKACIRISEYLAKELGQPCIMNIWTGDGFKDIPGDRMGPRVRYRQSIDEILSEPYDFNFVKPCIESKVFGIGVEAYTAGSAEFALSYAAFNKE